MLAMARLVADRYVLTHIVGRGAMGTVYAAHHRLTGERVALKIIPLRGSEPRLVVERFRREVSVAARVGHPGIVRVQDAGRDGDLELYLVMELLQGQDLEDYFVSKDFEISIGLRYLRAALEPLAAAHDARIVHRDIKPRNIYLHRQEDRLEIKLLDFGIAKHAGESDSGTRSDMGVGTPQYMSPEQATEAQSVAPASDVWSIGIILFRMIYGALPFEADTPFNTLRAVCEAPTPAPSPVTTEAARLVPIMKRCLDKNPDNRPQNARELAALWDDATSKVPPSRPLARPPRVKMRRVMLAALACLLAGTATAWGLTGLQSWRALTFDSRKLSAPPLEVRPELIPAPSEPRAPPPIAGADAGRDGPGVSAAPDASPSAPRGRPSARFRKMRSSSSRESTARRSAGPKRHSRSMMKPSSKRRRGRKESSSSPVRAEEPSPASLEVGFSPKEASASGPMRGEPAAHPDLKPRGGSASSPSAGPKFDGRAGTDARDAGPQAPYPDSGQPPSDSSQPHPDSGQPDAGTQVRPGRRMAPVQDAGKSERRPDFLSF